MNPAKTVSHSSGLFKKAARIFIVFSFAALWVSLFGAGEWVLLTYQKTPGIQAEAPVSWPAGTSVERTPGVPKLIMFVHPHCPCSRASIGELAILTARCSGKFDAEILFMKPTAMQKDWAHTDLWKSALEIPGVRVEIDERGEAERFHAATSGATLLYDVGGRLVFSGGITASRGHSGDNAGRAAIESFILEGRQAEKKTPVFGCFLKDQKLKLFEEAVQSWKNKAFSFLKKA